MMLLRFFETESDVGRALTVLKMRDSGHDRSHLAFTITDDGLTVGDVLTDLRGALGFSALSTDQTGGVLG